jgi:hypothetical protein
MFPKHLKFIFAVTPVSSLFLVLRTFLILRPVGGSRGCLSAVITLLATMGCALPLALAQLPNSGQTSVTVVNPPMSTADPLFWQVRAGYVTMRVSSQTAPDSSPVMEINITRDKGIAIQNTLVSPGDLRDYDSFAFWIRTAATRDPHFVFLIDGNGARRWFNLTLKAEWGWQRQNYLINSFIGQDAGFDLSNVVAVRFHQANLIAGDQIFIGPVSFELGTFLDHAESASSWYVDIGTSSSTLTTSTDAVGGQFSLLARVTGLVLRFRNNDQVVQDVIQSSDK